MRRAMNRPVKIGFPGRPESQGRIRTISRIRRAVRCSSVLNPQNKRRNLCELCAFAPLRETCGALPGFSQRRKGAKFAKVFSKVGIGTEKSQKSVNLF